MVIFAQRCGAVASQSESLHWRNLSLGHGLADFRFTKHGSAQIRDFLIDLLKRMLRELLRW
jgi:hypothetical protein